MYLASIFQPILLLLFVCANKSGVEVAADGSILKQHTMAPTGTPVWIDCDVGHDDALAIILAAYNPALNILGISSVSGNADIENTTANAARILEAVSITGVRIYKGASKPLVKAAHPATDVHGKTGLDGTSLLPPAKLDKYLDPDTNAVNAMRNAIMSSDEPIAIAAIGPLTNIALLVSIYPEVISKIKTLLIMGGAIRIGNVTPTSEFNMYYDPEAAQIVLNSGIEHIVLVPLDTTNHALSSRAVVSRIKNEVPDPLFARFAIDLLQFYGTTHKELDGIKDGVPTHDPAAILYLFMPEAFGVMNIFVEVQGGDGPASGQTICDVFGKTKRKPNCWVTTTLDADKFWDEMIPALSEASKNSRLVDRT